MVVFVERDAALASLVKGALEAKGFAATAVANAMEALSLVHEADLAVVDLNTCHDRVEELRRYRSAAPDMPLMALTANTSVEQRLRCLEAGADDCLAKPFAIAELVARCRSLLRRHQPALLRVDDLTLHRVERRVRRGGQPVELTRKEFELLEYLLLNAGQPVSRQSIAAEAWKAGAPTASNLVDVFINSLRKKLDAGHERKLIHTVRKAGYLIAKDSSHGRSQPDDSAA